MLKKVFLLFLTIFTTASLHCFGQETVRIIFSGDIMGHAPQMNAARQDNGSYDYTPCFRFVKDYIASADLAIANLEVTLAGKPYSSYPRFSSPDALSLAAKDAGFDILCTVNNHCLDKGKTGLERTLQVLDKQKILHLGTYRNAHERNNTYPLIVERKGIKIALMAYTYGVNGYAMEKPNVVNLIDTMQMRTDLKKAHQEKADYVITLIHWGTEYQTHSNAEQEQLAQWLLNNGSDIVVGGHPHVIQNVSMDALPNNGIYPQMVIYSLGNLISNQRDINCDGGIMVEIELEKSHNKTLHKDTTLLRSCAYMPYWVNKGTFDGISQYYIVPASDALNYPESYQIDPAKIAALRTFCENTRERMIQSVCTDTLRYRNYATLGDFFPERFFYHNRKPTTPRLYTYYAYDYNSNRCDTTQTFVYSYAGQFRISPQLPKEHPIPGLAVKYTYVDVAHDIIINHLHYADNTDLHWMFLPYRNPNLYKWDTIVESPTLTRYTTSINSNRIEILMNTAINDEVTPLPYLRYLPGVMQKMIYNGQLELELATTATSERQPHERSYPIAIPLNKGFITTPIKADSIEKERLIITTRIFDSVQLHWGENTDHLAAPWHVNNPTKAFEQFPCDTVIHFAGGTIALKRVHLPTLPSHYRLFAELHQRSNGDAYDRTGSLFIIPHNCAHTFFEGIYKHPDSLPIVRGRDGERYQGITATHDYLPPLELMRFFTPFGVHHFNNKMPIKERTWADEAYYKQEVTDLAPYLQGDVWIGAFIGNYDQGGHIITLDLKAYPEEETWSDTISHTSIVPLINTCNVLEMAGQNYGKIFGTDTLKVEFTLPKNAHNIQLRYLTTGHGGWGGGDEFNPKENTLLIDGQKRFCYTPWRCDCATYRELNPVSGNFWNGLSSSDYSRSGWCPGTITLPTYFNISDLSPGRHTLSIVIPQGTSMEGMFNSWNVSAALLIEQ